jgi:CBS domain-containing protein
MARGLPVEGERAADQRVIDIARQDVVTCELHDLVGPVRDRVARSPYGFAFVLTDGVLLGRLRKTALEGEPGPSTTRPDTAPEELLGKLQRADLTAAVLTDPDGLLLGIVRRADLESAF